VALVPPPFPAALYDAIFISPWPQNRLTGVMAHCADAFAAEGQSDSRRLKDARELATADAQSALRRAAARMRAAWVAHTEAADDSPSGSIRLPRRPACVLVRSACW
jgi:hypothetical protein